MFKPIKNKPTIAIPQQGCESYLTAGKEYEIRIYSYGLFDIADNDGTILVCSDKHCAHLNGLDWILK